MVLRFSFISIVILSTSSCSDEIPPIGLSNTEIIETCMILEGTSRISEEERSSQCTFFDVYNYRGEVYITCTCCICDKIGAPIDCDENFLYDGLDTDKYQEFIDEAKYLFSTAR